MTENKKNEGKSEFQALGLIYGKVALKEPRKYVVQIEGQEFSLRTSSCSGKSHRKRFNAQINKKSEELVYLRVYPSFDLKTKTLSFDLRGVYLEKPTKIQVNQFVFRGLWQENLAVCEQPVFSIYRNGAWFYKKLKTEKVNHFIIEGFEERPFQTPKNLKIKKTKKPCFHEIVANLDPQEGKFNFFLSLKKTEILPPWISFKQKSKQQEKIKVLLDNCSFRELQEKLTKLKSSGFYNGKIAEKGLNKSKIISILETFLQDKKAQKVLQE